MSSLLRVFLSGLLLFSLSACGNSEGGSNPGPPWGEQGAVIPSVEVVQTQLGTLPLEQRLHGVVEARNQVAIFPEVSGRIEQVLVDNGDFVQAGAPLVRLNPRQSREQLRQSEAQLKVQQASAEQAEARLRELQSELRRSEELAERDFVSELEIERLRAQVDAARADYNRALAVVESAEATVEEQQEVFSRTTIRAPVGGVVGRRNAEIGMSVDPSTQVFVVGDLSTVRVKVNLTERMVNVIDVGQTALIRTQTMEGDEVIEAEVSRISPFLEAGSFSTEATIDVPNPDGRLRSGMYVEVDILYGETEEATVVPNSALQEDPQSRRMGVFVASELGTQIEESELDILGMGASLSDPTPISYREIEVIARGRATTGVQGIAPGEWIVAVGQGLLNLAADPEEGNMARTRPIAWDRLIALQGLQEHDILRQFMEKQQRIASSDPDTSEDGS